MIQQYLNLLHLTSTFFFCLTKVLDNNLDVPFGRNDTIKSIFLVDFVYDVDFR